MAVNDAVTQADLALEAAAILAHDPYTDWIVAYGDTIQDKKDARSGISGSMDQQRRSGVATSGTVYEWMPVLDGGGHNRLRFAPVAVRAWTRGRANLAARKARCEASRAIQRQPAAWRGNRSAAPWAMCSPRGPVVRLD